MSAESEERVQYVVAGMPTGWAAMSKTIREVDEDKVNDYKEDIDTLLVFTGLFSAVLTAFVTVSYPMLSSDPQDTVIQYLAQISAQTNSYTVTAGTMNSTVPPLSQTSQSFQPSLTALRVNYCWFASLIITLITASFSMLVKQWLREYLAFDYTSPHERLRARQFRYPGLSTWKVYGIAGALPLLLQLGLGLFFLGLCFFTWSVNHGIGNMCATLVALWASFFVSATIAPFFSPRCPYKTALLKHVIISLRRHLRYLLYKSSLRRGLHVMSHIATSGVFPHAVFPSLPAPKPSIIEEADAIKQNTDELAILGEVDAFLLDDNLLGTTMLDSLTQSYVEPSALIKFVLQAISLRLKQTELTQPLSSPPDLRRLSKLGWIAVSDIVAAAIRDGLQAKATAVGDWVQDAIYLLLSVSEQPLTPSVRGAFLRVLQGATLPYVTKTFSSIALLPTTTGRFHDLLDSMSACIHELLSRPDVQYENIVAFIISFLSAEARHSMPTTPLESIQDLRSVSEPVWHFSSDLLAATIEEALKPDRKGKEIGSWLEDAIYVLLSPSSYPLTPAGRKALGRACLNDAPHIRLGNVVRLLASPDHRNFAHTLSRVHEVCQGPISGSAANWFLRRLVYSIPCTPRCTHPTTAVGPLLADHTPGHDEWTKHFTSILIERCKAAVGVTGIWPPGSFECTRALLSLPVSKHLLNPEIPAVLFTLICSLCSSASSLRSLVTVEPDWRSWIVPDAAARCVASLVVNSDTEGRRKFIHAMWFACNSYLSEERKTQYPQYGNINVVRHVVLASTVHASIQADKALFKDWVKYYATCAKALSIFRTTKYPTLPDEEKANTVRLAEECLSAIDNMEPVSGAFDSWETSFDAQTSAFPDAIFQELVAFVADTETAARKSRRVRRLRTIGTIPGGDVPSIEMHGPAHDVDSVVRGSPEHSESAVPDDDRKGLENESSLTSASPKPLSSPVRETKGVDRASRTETSNDDGDPGNDSFSKDSGPDASSTLENQTNTDAVKPTDHSTLLARETKGYLSDAVRDRLGPKNTVSDYGTPIVSAN